MVKHWSIILVGFLMALTVLTPTPTVHGAAAYDPFNVENSWLDESALPPSSSLQVPLRTTSINNVHSQINRGGAGILPAGYNPFGYKITSLGTKFLEFDGCLDSDIGRFIASIKERKTLANIKSQWLEIVRVSKKAQSMRIYRTLDDIIDFCLSSGLIN